MWQQQCKSHVGGYPRAHDGLNKPATDKEVNLEQKTYKNTLLKRYSIVGHFSIYTGMFLENNTLLKFSIDTDLIQRFLKKVK